MLARFAFATLATSAVLAGCGASEDQLRARAAYDFSCPQAQIQLVEIDSRTTGAEGCGKKVTYVESCNGPKNNLATECTWVANSPQ